MPGARLGAWRHLGEHQAALEHCALPLLVLRRVEDVDPARDHPDRSALQGAVVRRAVDAAGQPGHDRELVLAQIVRQPAREAASRGRSVASADNRHRHAVEQVEIAPGNEQRRRILQFAEQARIESLAERQVSRAELLDARDLALCLGAFAQAWRLAPAAPRKVRHGIERSGGAAEAADQLPEGDRSYAGCSDQPQPVDEVFVQAFALPMRGSVPSFRRRMFSRCFHRTSTAKPSSIGRSDE